MAMTEKRASFLRLAERRTNKVLEAMRILGNCSNRVSYEYTEEDVAQMFGIIEEELAVIKADYLQTFRETKTFSFSCKAELEAEYPKVDTETGVEEAEEDMEEAEDTEEDTEE